MFKVDNKTALVLEDGLSYMSGQRGRARSSNIDLMEKHRYVGFRYLLTQGCIMEQGIPQEGKRNADSKSMYRKYPSLQKALSERNTVYNQTMDLIERMEDEGKITVIRPLSLMTVVVIA